MYTILYIVISRTQLLHHHGFYIILYTMFCIILYTLVHRFLYCHITYIILYTAISITPSCASCTPSWCTLLYLIHHLCTLACYLQYYLVPSPLYITMYTRYDHVHWHVPYIILYHHHFTSLCTRDMILYTNPLHHPRTPPCSHKICTPSCFVYHLLHRYISYAILDTIISSISFCTLSCVCTLSYVTYIIFYIVISYILSCTLISSCTLSYFVHRLLHC